MTLQCTAAGDRDTILEKSKVRTTWNLITRKLKVVVYCSRGTQESGDFANYIDIDTFLHRVRSVDSLECKPLWFGLSAFCMFCHEYESYHSRAESPLSVQDIHIHVRAVVRGEYILWLSNIPWSSSKVRTIHCYSSTKNSKEESCFQ